MPYGDRTGPEGRGPRTGRGLGYCAGYDSPGYTRGVGRGMGRGFGRGRGRGFGRGFGRRAHYDDAPPESYYVPVYREPAPEDEKKYLEGYVKSLEEELEAVKKRMKELAKDK